MLGISEEDSEFISSVFKRLKEKGSTISKEECAHVFMIKSQTTAIIKSNPQLFTREAIASLANEALKGARELGVNEHNAKQVIGGLLVSLGFDSPFASVLGNKNFANLSQQAQFQLFINYIFSELARNKKHEDDKQLASSLENFGIPQKKQDN